MNETTTTLPAALRRRAQTGPAVSGALFGAVAAGRVLRLGDGRDHLLPGNLEADTLDVTSYIGALAAAGYVRPGSMRATNHSYQPREGTRWVLTGDGEIKASEYAFAALRSSADQPLESAG